MFAERAKHLAPGCPGGGPCALADCAARLPLSAVVGKVEILDSVGEGAVGGTYYGNPVACAAALVVMDYFDCLETLEHV